MNICLFSIKLPNLTNGSEVYLFQKGAFLLTFHGVDFDISIDTIVTLANEKKNKMVFYSEDLVLIKVYLWTL